MSVVCIGCGLTTDIDGRLVLALQEGGGLECVDGFLQLARTVTRVECSAQLALTAAYVDVAGLTYALPAGAGDAVITAAIDFEVTTAGTTAMTARLVVDGVAQPSLATIGEEAGRATTFQQWVVPKSGAPQTCKIQAKKGSAAGVAVVQAIHSTLLIQEIS